MAKEELAKVQVRNQKYYCNGTAVVKFGHRNRKACRPPDAASKVKRDAGAIHSRAT